jgi:predicted ATPase
MQKKIVITGGPGSGKSVVINELKQRDFICMPEISREVTLSARKNGIEQLFINDPILFSKMLLEGRILQYQEAGLSGAKIVFFDRGLPDVNAYLDYSGIKYDKYFHQMAEGHAYHKIFIMPPWLDIYEMDTERYESYDQAREIYLYIEKIYLRLGYELISVPLGSVEERVDFILKQTLIDEPR